MQVIDRSPDIVEACRQATRPLGLVPTMGALHEGHLSLVRRGRQDNETLAVSIFVNPTQFGSGEDLVSYPRDLDRDLGLLSEGGVDLVFTPAAEEIYPPGFDTWVDAGHLGEVLEGVHRPGHFRGVATVVTKLFNLMRPDRAYFGQKDGQQTVVIRQLVRDLALDVDLVVLPTVRQPDGLALSSRNVHLTPEQSAAAPVIYRVLCRAQETWQSGNREANSLRRLVVQMLETEPLVDAIEYVSVADGQSLAELEHVTEGAMVSLAVRVGQTRLIDNVILQ